MSDAAPTTDFPTRGDNFVTLGPWRLLAGATWHAWQLDAETAHLRAAEADGDALGVQRATRRRRRMKAAGPLPVPLRSGLATLPGDQAGRG